MPCQVLAHEGVDSELRSIELIVQQRTAIEGMEVGERDTLAKLQEILYSTVVRSGCFWHCLSD